MTTREISREDIMPMDTYASLRDERRRAVTGMKKDRRLAVGPDMTLYFENYDTMLHQIHEMLYIERGGEAQLEDELRAYNPLVPGGNELVATMMIEIDEPRRRQRVLAGLGGVEETITLSFDGETVTAVAEEDVDRTTADGKASSVHFLHFPFTAEQIARFRTPGTRVLVGVGHPQYEHMTVMPERVRQALSADFD